MPSRPSPAILRALGGPDEPTLCELFERLGLRLRLFVRHRGIDDAEDVVQETFLAALVQLRAGRFAGHSSLQTWVYGILLHKIADARQALAREARHLTPLNTDLIDALVRTSTTVPQPSPELAVLVDEVLDSLPPRHWLVLILNQRERLTTHEIARIIGLSPGRTGAVLAEAKKMFRRGVSGREEKTRRTPTKQTKDARWT